MASTKSTKVPVGKVKRGSKPAAGPGKSKKKSRLWLMYPPRLITNPVIWELGHEFSVVTNVRQASVTDEIGIVCLEIEGAPDEITRAIAWLTRQGISVEPVEINVLES